MEVPRIPNPWNPPSTELDIQRPIPENASPYYRLDKLEKHIEQIVEFIRKHYNGRSFELQEKINFLKYGSPNRQQKSEVEQKIDFLKKVASIISIDLEELINK